MARAAKPGDGALEAPSPRLKLPGRSKSARSRLRRRAVVGISLFLVAVGSAAVWVSVASARDLLRGKTLVLDSRQGAQPERIEEAIAALDSARDRIDSPLGYLARLVPLARQNLNAVRGIAASSIPVLEARLDLHDELGAIDDVFSSGRVRLSTIEHAKEPLLHQAQTLRRLEQELGDHRSGWLVPPLWDSIDEGIHAVNEMRRTADKVAQGAQLAGPMLGAEGSRKYLVLLMNNAEARAAGGILSGTGTISFEKGRLTIGEFRYHGDLDDPPFERVRAPADFKRRFGRYEANTTHLVNATMSPDLPEVAAVVQAIHQRIAPVDVDGAIFVDPRGVAALMPPGARVATPSGASIGPADIPSYTYSDAYRDTPLDQGARRRILLDVGDQVFDLLAEQGFSGESQVNGVWDSTRAGHIRVVSFNDNEQRSLESIGITGDLRYPGGDTSFVTVQNWGADKLDYWARRSIAHSCVIGAEEADCSQRILLRNTAPKGLPSYVTQGKGKAALESFVEAYLPSTATVTAAELNGKPAPTSRQKEDGYVAVGSMMRVARGDTATLRIDYTIPTGEDVYSLNVNPQPLAHDARFSVDLVLPDGWDIRGPSGLVQDGETVRYAAKLDQPVTFTARNDQRSGLPWLWERTLGG